MKTLSKLFIGLFLLTFTLTELNAQDEETMEYPDPTFYLGVGTGVNHINGMLGFNGELQAGHKFTVIGGVGLSSWGIRGTAGFRYYKHYPGGLYYTASYSGNSGGEGIEIDLETTGASTETVTIDFHKVGTINLGLGTQIAFAKNRARLNLELGYAVPLQQDTYEVTSDHELSDVSEAAMKLIAPGGIILALGLSVGF